MEESDYYEKDFAVDYFDSWSTWREFLLHNNSFCSLLVPRASYPS